MGTEKKQSRFKFGGNFKKAFRLDGWPIIHDLSCLAAALHQSGFDVVLLLLALGIMV